MKPAAFDYGAPETLDGVRAALAAAPAGTRLLAGGQSLIPLLNARLARPPMLIDLNRVPGLSRIRLADGELGLGATVRMAEAEHSPEVRAACPLLAEALPWVANPQVRNRATIVGNLVFANRGSELPAVALALDATFVIESADGGTRRCPAAEFYRPGAPAACGARDFVSAVLFPRQAAGSGCAFLEAQRRSAHYALIGVAAALVIRSGLITEARLALAGASPFPVRCRSAEQLLTGQAATPGLLAAASGLAGSTATLLAYDDLHATADYRRAVAPELITRALWAARDAASAP